MECDSQSQSDYYYIRKLFFHKYSFNYQNDKIAPLFLAGKQNYHSSRIQKQIKRMKDKWSGVTKVIYFFDTDERDIMDSTENRAIIDYCREHQFECVWFVKNIEQVFISTSETQKSKVQLARNFVIDSKMGLINQYDKITVSYPKNVGESNILCILDKYFKRKEDNNE